MQKFPEKSQLKQKQKVVKRIDLNECQKLLHYRSQNLGQNRWLNKE